MSRKRSKGKSIDPTPIDMTPMIDIVFQLLIFFVLTAKFVENEGQLLAYLPKERGTKSTPQPVNANPLTIFLRWKGSNDAGECLAITNNYQPPEGGNIRLYQFPQIDPASGPANGWPANERVTYRYPDYGAIRAYMEYRLQRADAAGGRDKLPVTITFQDAVPVQMVVNMLDICQMLKITDFAINAEGIQ